MALDAILLSGIIAELRPKIIGARIDKVQQPERDKIVLSVRGDENMRLLIDAGAGSGRLQQTKMSFENPAEPPMFCMLLRKHLVGARITGISQPDFERMLVLDLDGRDELGTPVKKQLIVEMLGRQSNVILVSADGHIIDCMRRVDSSMSETRQVQPGLFYRLPLRQDKPVLFDTTPEQRAQLLSGPVTAATLDKWLLGLFSGVSPLLCREVCFRALGDASPRLERLDDAQREALLRLCAEEVLTSIPRCGYVVVRVGEKSGRDNMVVRAMLETASLERYFDLFTPERIEHIARKLEVAREICAKDKSIWTVWQQNITFHSDLISISDNPYLVKHLTNCIEVERRFYAQNHFGLNKGFETKFCPEAHELILEAIRKGDKEQALARLKIDILDT